MKKLLNYLSFRGRTNRARFWLTGIAIYAVMIVASVLVVELDHISPLFGVLFVPVFLGALIGSLANATRRLHDRGKSAWWLLLFVGLPAILTLPAEGAKDAGPGPAALAAICALASLPFSIWGFVEMGCLKGGAGPNKYGDDPLQRTAEVFA